MRDTKEFYILFLEFSLRQKLHIYKGLLISCNRRWWQDRWEQIPLLLNASETPN